MNLELPLALVCFLAPHVLPSIRGLRSRLIGRFGRGAYFTAYTILSVVTFVWLILAILRAPYVELWTLRPWHVYVASTFVALACILFIAGLFTSNPLSLSIRTAGIDAPDAAILGITRHPLMWALGLWGLSHVLVNGDVGSVFLFGVLAIFALGYMPLLDRRVQKARGMEAWHRLSTGTSNMLFAAYFGKGSRPLLDGALILSIAGGLVLFTLLLNLHSSVIGVAPLAVIFY
jgi:uncharacterized membrane protein